MYTCEIDTHDLGFPFPVSHGTLRGIDWRSRIADYGAMNTSGRPRLTLKRLLLAAASILATLIVIEAVLTMLHLPPEDVSFELFGREFSEGKILQTDPVYFWTLRRDNSSYHANHLHLRGYAPKRSKNDRTLRIACVGDSCTFGLRLAYEQTYGIRLELSLQEALPRANVETVLAALPGYSSFQNRQLFERRILPLKPDITILYCGHYNDYIPAIGCSDSERFKRLQSIPEKLARSFRTLRAASALFSGKDPPVDRQSILEQMRRGESTQGVRVPEGELRENLLSLIRMGRSNGGKVIAVLPPLPSSTLNRFLLASVYLNTLKEVAAESDVPVLDASAAFEKHWKALPDRIRREHDFDSLYFYDYVHPTALANRLLSEELFAMLNGSGFASIERLRSLGEPGKNLPEMHSATYNAAAPMETPAVVLEGRNFSGPGAPGRVRIGDRWIPKFEILHDSRINVDLPYDMMPGRHKITLCTPLGMARGDVFVEVPGLPLEVNLEQGDESMMFIMSVAGPPDSDAVIFYSPSLRPDPIVTDAGPFFLSEDSGGRDENPGAVPYRLSSLTLPKLTLKLDGTGHAEKRFPLPLWKDADVSSKYWFQGAVKEAGKNKRSVVTEVVEVRLH